MTGLQAYLDMDNRKKKTMKLPSAIQNYPGNKAMQGLTEKIINQIPPHDVYVERFAGSAAIWRAKRPAALSVLNEIDGDVCGLLSAMADAATVVCRGAALDLDLTPYAGKRVFVFDDPPYPIAARLSGSKIYRYEMTDADHVEYLERLVLPCPFPLMVCSNPNPIYSDMLAGWRRIEVPVNYRGGPGVEVLYMNYPDPEALHEYTYLGNDSWDRQRIARKIKRHVSRLRELPPLERMAIVEKIKNSF